MSGGLFGRTSTFSAYTSGGVGDNSRPGTSDTANSSTTIFTFSRPRVVRPDRSWRSVWIYLDRAERGRIVWNPLSCWEIRSTGGYHTFRKMDGSTTGSAPGAF